MMGPLSVGVFSHPRRILTIYYAVFKFHLQIEITRRGSKHVVVKDEANFDIQVVIPFVHPDSISDLRFFCYSENKVHLKQTNK